MEELFDLGSWCVFEYVNYVTDNGRGEKKEEINGRTGKGERGGKVRGKIRIGRERNKKGMTK